MLPTIAISFDHPSERFTFSEQIQRARAAFDRYPNLGREILFKPERLELSRLDVPRLSAEISHFPEFDVIGMTETELGTSIVERMANIARIRQAMGAQGVTKPLHIFGSLDPICTTLYFLAGADIFDGLSWVRFAYRDDMAVYHKNRSPLAFGIKLNDHQAIARNLSNNLDYLLSMTDRLQRYIVTQDEDTLGLHGEFFATALDDLRTEFGGTF